MKRPRATSGHPALGGHSTHSPGTVITKASPRAQDSRMPGGPNVFRFPLDAHSTDSGLVGLDATAASTAPAPWTASEYSTFDEPSHASERAQAFRRREQLQERLITLGLLLVAAGAAVVVFLFAPR